MIKEYLDYKRKKVEEIANSLLIGDNEKQSAIDEYNLFLSEAFSDKYPGKIILSKKIISELMQLVKSGKFPLVINEYDTAIVFGPDMPNGHNNPQPFRRISDLVAVHKTVIPPVGDKILTKENNGDGGEIIFKDPATGILHSVSYPSGSDTIHFTLNCAVENHCVGNDWDSYKYAVMLGLDKLDKSKILDVKSEDTYVDGDAELGNEYILFCPAGEREKMHEANPNAMIIEYENIPLNVAIASMIVYTGRKIESYETYGWDRASDRLPESYDNKELNRLLRENGYPVLTGPLGAQLHSESKYMARRMWKREYEAIIALVEYNKANGIDMPVETMQFLIRAGGGYATPGLLEVSVSLYKEFVLPILERHGYNVGDELFEGIDSDAHGMKYISHFPDPDLGGLPMPSLTIPSWENELRDRVIRVLMSDKKVNTDENGAKGNGKR